MEVREQRVVEAVRELGVAVFVDACAGVRRSARGSAALNAPADARRRRRHWVAFQVSIDGRMSVAVTS
jgi:hypothetical protein